MSTLSRKFSDYGILFYAIRIFYHPELVEGLLAPVNVVGRSERPPKNKQTPNTNSTLILT